VRGLLTAVAARGRPRRAALALCLLASTALGGGALAADSRARKAATADARQPAAFAQSAATFYALNCMGCHPPPRDAARDDGPLRGEFYHSALGRNFFVRIPLDGRRALGAAEDARLLEEIMTWKRSCAAILQDAPPVNYSGERFVK